MTNSPLMKPIDSRAARSGRILVVDDEPALLRSYVRWLEAGGHAVESALDGNSAATLVAESDFDVIVSDIAMPGMDGTQLLRKVRERDLDVPVILVTGSPTVETAIKAVEYGALRYLVKPFEGAVLLDAASRAVRLHKIAKLKRQALALAGEGSKQLGDLAGLSASLDRAMASLWMAYQPIVAWSTKRTFGFEALLRSAEPTLPHPGAILEAAERLGRLEEIGRAIRERVASAIEGSRTEYLFVNLHTRDLLDESLYSPVAPLSKLAGRVVLEITERVALDEVKDAVERVARLREMGFRVALDDLGAGYAGLTSFAQLEPDIVKFDLSLVRGIHENETKRKLVQSMTSLFQELGMIVIAEGIESTADRDAIVAAGCDLLQGYLFARPGKPFPSVTW
jgi:EAL domain-containing protein (putative c-di-GMP-specific phosphodiesterase class I)/ActR/RegA family two-component response regulator